MRLIYRSARRVRREAIEGVWEERDIGRKRTKSIRLFEWTYMRLKSCRTGFLVILIFEFGKERGFRLARLKFGLR